MDTVEVTTAMSYFLMCLSIFFVLPYNPTSNLSFLLFLVPPLVSHSSFSSFSAPSSCSSCSRSYYVSPVILSFYNVTTCRIVSSETQTTKRFYSVRLQLKFCTHIKFPPSTQHVHFRKFKNLGFFTLKRT
jgi:hypothetical protein